MKCADPVHCVFCGSAEQIERHHLGGKNHIAWITAPLCQHHHRRITAMIHQAGVDMRYTPDFAERIRRARQTTLIFLWMLDDMQEPKQI